MGIDGAPAAEAHRVGRRMKAGGRAPSLFVLFTFVAVPGSHALAASKQVPAGSWGGRHVLLIVKDTGATIEFDCAHGVLPAPIPLTKSGTFEVKGTFVPERPGPRLDGQEQPERPATFSGRVHDREMELSFKLEDGQDEMDTFTLVLGQDPRLRKCR